MRPTILAFCIALPLSACQATLDAHRPPLAFSPFAHDAFEQYLAELKPILFVVSNDGRVVKYTYCPAFADNCRPVSGPTKSKILKDCEVDSGGVPCGVYAVGRRVVWKGNGASVRTAGSASTSDYEICNFAITTKGGTAIWDSRVAWLGSVNEAKRRHLTPEQCAELLGTK